MKNLTTLDSYAVSGGNAERLTVTQKVSLEGISETCINTMLNVNLNILTEEDEAQAYIKLLSNCTLTELNLIEDRIDAAPFLTVNYK